MMNVVKSSGSIEGGVASGVRRRAYKYPAAGAPTPPRRQRGSSILGKIKCFGGARATEATPDADRHDGILRDSEAVKHPSEGDTHRAVTRSR
jgi:hypothetical protein